MTAIALYVCSNGICVLSDGIAYDDEAIVRQIHSKQLLLTACNAVMTASASGPVLGYLRPYIDVEPPAHFDELLERMPEWCRSVRDRMYEYHSRCGFVILMGGWSEKQDGWCGKLISTEPWPDETGSPTEPFSLVSIRAFAKPQPTDDALRRQGLPAPDPWPAFSTMPVSEFGARMMLAQRASPMRLHHDAETVGYGVGGFIEQTFLERDRAETRILLRWPDVIGERADPSGDPDFCISTTDRA